MSKAVPTEGGAKGYVRIYRKMLDNPLFTDKPAGRFKLWVSILLRVNWRPSVFRPRTGKPVEIPAGSMITSLEKLAHTGEHSREQTRKCLEYLERTHTITRKRTHHWTMVTVVNWPSYQQWDSDGEHTEEHAPEHSESKKETLDGTHRRTHAGTLSKESKKNSTTLSNSGELDSLPPPAPKQKQKPLRDEIDPDTRIWFESEFWPIYPRHEAKAPALKAAAKKATTPEKRAFYLDRLKAQLPEYNRRKAESGQRVIPLAATWFNQDRADDELPSQEPNRNGRLAPVDNDYPEYVPLEA